MSIRLGTTSPSALRLGNTAVSKLMLGNTEVWSSVFDPMSLSPALWLDASDASTLFSDTAGTTLAGADVAIARWNDKSGNARHASQSTSGNRPLRKTSIQNSKDIARFDGSNDSMLLASALDPLSIFAVVRNTSNNLYKTVYGGLSSSSGSIESVYLQVGTPARTITFLHGTSADNTTSGDFLATAGVIGLNAFGVISGVRTSTQITAYLNGVAGSTDTTANTLKNNTANTVGAGYYGNAIVDFWPGDIAEIIAFDTTLSTTNRQAVERYLGTKWGITVA